MLEMDQTLNTIISLAEHCHDVVIVWLFGSRATGMAHHQSDYDLAVAFQHFIKNDPVERRLRPECLAVDWRHALGLQERQLSIVDINQAPVPLAFEIINANTVLYCRNQDRLWQEILRIHNRMELDYG